LDQKDFIFDNTNFGEVFMFKLFFLLFPITVSAQQFLENELDSAFINAKKGVYWAMSQVNIEKSRIDNELISDDKKYCSVKMRKEINGVKIESRGYSNSTEVFLKIYRSNESLEKEGYLKKEEPEHEGTQKKKKL
jgi:hypothetical protein